VQKYVVADARPEDVYDLKRIETECGLSPWTIQAYESEFLRSDSIMLKAQGEDGEIFGFLVGRAPRDNGDAEIYNLGTAPAFRRKGIASMLLREFRTVCVERRISAVWLEVRATNNGAIDFYRSHGFESKGIRRNFYSDPAEDAVLMALSLTASDHPKL
jgi:ribosomal-protein-alanine N-acetyltransferase